jgi:hypothetical protein
MHVLQFLNYWISNGYFVTYAIIFIRIEAIISDD